VLDIKLIRTEPQRVKKAMKDRGVAVDISMLVDSDERHRKALAELEEARALQNAQSKEKASSERIQELKDLKERIKELQADADEAE
jgi:seryl-tRNA synthetase